MLDRQIIKFTV